MLRRDSRRQQTNWRAPNAAGHPWIKNFRWAAIASVALGIPTILLRAIGALRRRLLDINILMIIAVAGATALSCPLGRKLSHSSRTEKRISPGTCAPPPPDLSVN